MTGLRCEKESVRLDHMDYDYMTALWCEKEPDGPDHMGLMSVMGDVLVMMWCMRWVMKAWFVVVWLE